MFGRSQAGRSGLVQTWIDPSERVIRLPGAGHDYDVLKSPSARTSASVDASKQASLPMNQYRVTNHHDVYKTVERPRPTGTVMTTSLIRPSPAVAFRRKMINLENPLSKGLETRGFPMNIQPHQKRAEGPRLKAIDLYRSPTAGAVHRRGTGSTSMGSGTSTFISPLSLARARSFGDNSCCGSANGRQPTSGSARSLLSSEYRRRRLSTSTWTNAAPSPRRIAEVAAAPTAAIGGGDDSEDAAANLYTSAARYRPTPDLQSVDTPLLCHESTTNTSLRYSPSSSSTSYNKPYCDDLDDSTILRPKILNAQVPIISSIEDAGSSVDATPLAQQSDATQTPPSQHLFEDSLDEFTTPDESVTCWQSFSAQENASANVINPLPKVQSVSSIFGLSSVEEIPQQREPKIIKSLSRRKVQIISVTAPPPSSASNARPRRSQNEAITECVFRRIKKNRDKPICG